MKTRNIGCGVKRTLLALGITGIYCWLVMSQACAAPLSDSATIPVTVTKKQLTCSLGFNGTSPSLTYNLGRLGNGQVQHSPFTVDITCEGDMPVKTAVTAMNMNGRLLPGDERLIMPVDGNTGTEGPLLWLESDGKPVKLTGSASDAFCAQTGLMSSCRLSPVTEVKASDPRGQINAVIRFEVVYPA